MIKRGSIVLEPFEMKYLDNYFTGFNGEVTKYQWPDPFESIDDAQAVLQGFIDDTERGEMLFFSVLSDDGAFVGSAELHGLDGDCPEVGIWIIESERSKGYAYDALCAMLELAHEKYGKHEFFYEADTRNEASAGLLKKLGATYDITDLETDELITDTGKQLKLCGHTLKVR
ncbi:MAG: GNAT family N-acetyltransferase [Clostridia bacterium]|nr:GNAT family N-acetyltransferase [Clostridia bacterium]